MILALIRLAERLPYKTRRKLGGLVGGLFYHLSSRDRMVTKLQMQKALGKEASDKFAKAVFTSIGITASDTLGAATIFQQDPSIVNFADLEPILQYPRRGQGVLLLSAHTGNWDLLGAALARSNVEVFAVGRRANNPRMQGVLEHLRNACKMKIIWRGDSNQKEEISAVLKSGKILGALIDQDIKASGCFADFFGDPAYTPTGAITLAMRARAPIVFAFTFRDVQGHYRVVSQVLENPESPQSVATLYNRFLEQAIRKHPEQWVWFHKRWRTDPAGNRRSSKEYLNYLRSRCASVGANIAGFAAILVLACLTLSSCRSILGLSGSRLLSRAEEYSRQGQTEDAIEAYNEHIAERLDDKKRPDWENPYFYELIIGDLYLRENKVSEALLSYERAENNKVDLVLVSDRYRYVASWYEKKGDLMAAIEILKKYRDRDSLLFDAMLDRLAKEIVATSSKSEAKKSEVIELQRGK